jgi:DUF438 domain-containing protein
MRLYEFVSSDEQVIGIIKPILIRAKAEGANSISTQQLSNDIDDSSITAEILVDILNRHRAKFKNLVSTATLETVELTTDHARAMTSKHDHAIANMKNVAANSAANTDKTVTKMRSVAADKAMDKLK